MKQKHKTLFVKVCVDCGKSMVQDDGTGIGGVVRRVTVDDETIWGTTCWECVINNIRNTQGL